MPINSLLEVIVTFITLTVSLFVYAVNTKTEVNRLFFYFCFSSAIWISSNVLIDNSHNYNIAIFFTRLAIIFVAFIPIFFNKLIQQLYFSDDLDYKKRNHWVTLAASIFIIIFILFSQTNLNVVSIDIKSWGVDFQPGVF
jgi:hypothetical protein